ncbi:MAG: DUF2341 domain-containing protein [Deltaproteobacteria bacterium]|jgi:hypothetical protein|nr:DUF2341 domain-containing protein [Deltaproteobacteria bacterium]MBW2534150.1 DUF2341 domain-containing protein [Deltaproteobacteria bacterium]
MARRPGVLAKIGLAGGALPTLMASVVLSAGLGCAALAGLDEDFVVGSVTGTGGSQVGGSSTTTTGTGAGVTGGTGGTAAGTGGTGGVGGAWYDSDWSYRKELSVDHQQVAGDLTGFPLLVRLDGDSDLAAHAESGAELLFTAADGVTKLPHEIELFTSAGRVDARVLVPLLSSTSDTVIHLYYGNPSALDQQDPQAVWASGFVGVWHLSEPSGTRRDSTSRANHVAEHAGPIATTADAISGDATADFESSSAQHLTVSDAAQNGLDLTGPFTLTAWIQAESQPGGWRNYLAKWAGGGDEANSGNSYYMAENSAGAGHRVKFAMDGAGGLTTLHSTTVLGLGVWYHVAAVYDGAQMRIYVDGVPEGSSQARASGARDSDTAFDIGGKSSNPAYNHDGPMDEVRAADVARSDAWILTAFRNQAAPTTFLTISAEQPR